MMLLCLDKVRLVRLGGRFQLLGVSGAFAYRKICLQHTVDGQNPAPPRMMIIPLFIGF